MSLWMSVGGKHVWRSRYSTFNDWRDYIYAIAGAPDMESFPIQKRNGYGYWRETPAEPLVVLMIHHDDTGYIFPRDAKALKSRIESLKPLVSNKWERHTIMFLKALTQCIKLNEKITFQ